MIFPSVIVGLTAGNFRVPCFGRLEGWDWETFGYDLGTYWTVFGASCGAEDPEKENEANDGTFWDYLVKIATGVPTVTIPYEPVILAI